mmetsp:Transcript_14471/g.16059  ORF Transcript_14471/g.16059 Transcript_14471/m.16059 type:complete len:457 (+) Transcript_14471:53-1423(+)
MSRKTHSISKKLPKYIHNTKNYRLQSVSIVEQGHVVATYKETGTYVIYSVHEKNLHFVDFKTTPVLLWHLYGKQMISFHKNELSQFVLVVYNMETRKKVEIDQSDLGFANAHVLTVVVEKSKVCLVLEQGFIIVDTSKIVNDAKSSVSGCLSPMVWKQGSVQYPPSPKESLSRLRGNMLLLASFDAFQVWDISLGTCVQQGSTEKLKTSAFELETPFRATTLLEKYVAGYTSQELYVWRIKSKRSRPTKIELPEWEAGIRCFAFRKSTIAIGALGTITLIKKPTKPHYRTLYFGKSKNVLLNSETFTDKKHRKSQRRGSVGKFSKVNNKKNIKIAAQRGIGLPVIWVAFYSSEVVVAATKEDVSWWDLERPDCTPTSTFHIGKRIKACHLKGNTVYILKNNDEVITWRLKVPARTKKHVSVTSNVNKVRHNSLKHLEKKNTVMKNNFYSIVFFIRP